MKLTHLLNLSGGVDSVSCLYQLLSAAKAGEGILIHHSRFTNREGRHPYEYEATQKALEWVKGKGLDRFQYIETGIDFTGITYAMWDLMLVGFWEGSILRTYKRINTLVITGSQTGIEGGGARWRRITNVRKTVAQAIAGRPLHWIMPNGQKSKGQVLQEIPQELRDITWFCRTPTSEGEPCGRCGTCRRVFSSGVPWRGRTKA